MSFVFVLLIEELADGSHRGRQQGQSCRVVSMAMLSHDENSERNTVDRVQVNNGGAKVEVYCRRSG